MKKCYPSGVDEGKAKEIFKDLNFKSRGGGGLSDF